MQFLRFTSGAVFALAALAFCAAPAVAQVESGDGDLFPGVDIIRIEEDWLLNIADPDPAADCPQVVTVFGPTDPSSGTHCVFELNHGTEPNFNEGGMQVQVWWGDNLVGYKTQHAPTEFYVAIEQVTYTTVIEVQNAKLNLFVTNGESVTFGNFGDSGTTSLKIQLDTARTNLNAFDPGNSIEHSRVSYGANRVNRFVRSEIRYYTASGLHHTDSTETVVHELAEAAEAPDPVNP